MKGMVAALALMPCIAFARTVVYDVAMVLRVPVVLRNETSQGMRVARTQALRGVMEVRPGLPEPEIAVTRLENLSHQVGGRYISYDVSISKVGWHAIGDNRTGRFRQASVFFSVEAKPSYALAGGEDNTLILTLSGSGTTDAFLSGHAAGQIGCGCSAYGHVSPTRIYGTELVVDTAGVWGTWRAVKREER